MNPSSPSAPRPGDAPQPPQPPHKPHPARFVAVLFFVLAGLAVTVTGMSILGGASVVHAAPMFVVSGLCVFMGRWYRRRIAGVQGVNRAVQHYYRGDYAATRAALAACPHGSARSLITRARNHTLGLVALDEGRIDDAIVATTAATTAALDWLQIVPAAELRAASRSVRGMAYAAKGAVAEANADADAVEASVDALPEVLARARLIRAVALSKADDRAPLAQYLETNASAILTHACPRERSLYRALRKMCTRPTRSVYREPAEVSAAERDAPTAVGSWIAAISPDAARFAEHDTLASSMAEAPLSVDPADVQALDRARATAPQRRGTGRTIALWVILVVMLVVIWQVLAIPAPTDGSAAASAAAASTSDAEGDGSWSYRLMAIFVGLVAVLLGTLAASGAHAARKLSRAIREAAFGDRTKARADLEKLARTTRRLLPAQAELQLAIMAREESAFPDAVSRCSAALAKLGRAQPGATDIAIPSLMTESAVASAARGQTDEAMAELALLSREHPGFAYLPTSHVRVQLVVAVRRGDLRGGAAAARTRTAQMRIPLAEDLLADLALATEAPLSDDEADRLERELASDELARRFVDAVAPGLRDRVLQAARAARATGATGATNAATASQSTPA